MVRAPGTIVYGRLERDPTKAVFICRVRVKGSADESAWILAVPASKEEEKAREVPMTGGDGEDLEHTGFAKLIALRNMDGWKPQAPRRGKIRTWPDAESAPRLDALSALVKAEDAAPFDRAREEFHFSDDANPPTEQESADEDAPRRIPSRGTSRLEVIPEVGEVSPELLRQAAKMLGAAPKVAGSRPRRGRAEESAEGGRRGAERSKREEAGSRGGRGGGSPPSSSGASSQSPDDSSSDEGSREKKKKKKEKKSSKKKKSKKKKRRDRSSSSSSSSRGRSSSSDADRAGRGSRKIASYEKLKKRHASRPIDRWRHVEKCAAEAGYSGPNAVELYLGECTKLGKARSTAYLAALLARIGHEAANGRPELAAGTAAAALGYLDTLYVQGETDLAWRTTLGEDPIIVTRSTLPKAQSIPEPSAKAKAGANVAFAHRMAFSTLIPSKVLESTLEAGKQWKAWDEMTRQ